MNFSHIPYFRRVNGDPLSIEDMYKGQSIFLVSSGPSQTPNVLQKLATPGIMRMGLNNSPSIIRPHLWTSVDQPSNFLKSIWLDPTIQKFIYFKHLNSPIWDSKSKEFIKGLCPKKCPNIVTYDRSKHLDFRSWLTSPIFNWGLQDDEEFLDPITSEIFIGGRSVMLVAVKILILLGFKRIYLTGCDFNMQPDKPYAFKENKSPQACITNNRTYNFINAYFNNLHDCFKKAGVVIQNCTPNSGLTAFPYKDLDEAITETLDPHLINISAEPTEGMYIKNK